MTSEHYDVIIIGTGAGGGTLAHKLAPSGKRILLLERGGYLPREPENWDSREIFQKDRYLSDEVWYDKDGEAFKPHQQYFVGGNTKFYEAILFRLRERDFGEIRHYGGLSPAWPISYPDSSQTTPRRRGSYLVHGRAGEDPTEPPRSGPFPYPQVSHEPRIQQLADDFEKTGHRPFHLPVGVDLNESDPEAGRCVRCDRFDGFPCLTDGKADAHVRCVRPALQRDNVTLVTHAKAERLVTIGTGHSITEVVVDRRGVRETYSGDIVVVSCGAVNSAALLLKSGSDRHPNGLANASDVVGRHYMARTSTPASSLISQTPNPTKFQKTLGINDYYWGADDSELPLGHIQMLAKSDRKISPGRCSVVRARARARLRRQARDPLLDHHRGPAPPGQPGDGGPAGPHPPGQDLPQPRAPSASAGQAQGTDGPAGLPRDRHPGLVNPRQAHPAGRSRPPVRHGALR